MYNQNEIRTVIKDGEPWLVLKDVCAVLDIVQAVKVAERLDEDEVTQTHITDNLGRKQNTYIINESGLYNVILRSDKPEAKPFRKWVTSEVLPSIRKTGHYGNTPLKDIINLIRITRDNMKEQGATAKQIAETINGICNQYGINLPNFVIEPEEITLQDVMDMVDYIYVQPKGKGYKKPTYDDFIIHQNNIKVIGKVMR